ncbi:MAG: SprT-like domain-containing protein [Verrucomicrobiota bacterium]
MVVTKRKCSIPDLPMQRQFGFHEKGRFFDLRALFDRLNAVYFEDQLEAYTIVWGRKRRLRPRNGIVFGSIQEEKRLIRIHPLLDQAFVPRWFVEYVIYHEMCHAVVPDEFHARGGRIVHHERFYARERKFYRFRRAKAWEKQNLARFLR